MHILYELADPNLLTARRLPLNYLFENAFCNSMINSIMYDCEPRIQKQLIATYDYWNIPLKIVVELKSSMWSTVSVASLVDSA